MNVSFEEDPGRLYDEPSLDSRIPYCANTVDEKTGALICWNLWLSDKLNGSINSREEGSLHHARSVPFKDEGFFCPRPFTRLN